MKKNYYGYDSNGCLINESTAEEQYWIAEHNVLPETELGQIGDASISEDSFEFYFGGGIQGAVLKYDIDFDTDDEHIDLMNFIRSGARFYPDFRSEKYTADIRFTIHVNMNKIAVDLAEADVYEDDIHSTYFTDRFNECIDIERLCDVIREITESAVREIQRALSNL